MISYGYIIAQSFTRPLRHSLDDDISPHGQDERERYGRGVQHLGHVRVQQHVHGAHVRELLLLGGGQVHVARERRVLDHQGQVGQGQPAQNPVDRRTGQVLARQHRDVERVGQCAEQAQEQADVAVHCPEQQRVALHGAAAVVATGVRLVVEVRRPVRVFRDERRDVDQVLQIFLRQVQAAQVRHQRVVIPQPVGRHVRAQHGSRPAACAAKTII
jgi:hypothetical protein